MKTINVFKESRLLTLEKDKPKYMAWALKAYEMFQEGISKDFISKKLGFDLYRNIENVLYDGELFANNDFCIADIAIGTHVGERVIDGKWRKVYIIDCADVFGLNDINDIMKNRKLLEILYTYPQLVCPYEKINRVFKCNYPSSCDSFRKWLKREYGLQYPKDYRKPPRQKKQKEQESSKSVEEPKVIIVKDINEERMVNEKINGKVREDPLSCLYIFSSCTNGTPKQAITKMYDISDKCLEKSLRYGRQMYLNSKNLEILAGKYLKKVLNGIEIMKITDIRSKNFSKKSFKKILSALARREQYAIDLVLDYVYDYDGKDDIQQIIEFLLKNSAEYKGYLERYNDLYFKFYS